MTDVASATSPSSPAFDVVLVVSPDAFHVVAGVTLVSRAAFAAARAGARRLLFLGVRPPSPIRLPDVAHEWMARDDVTSHAAWTRGAAQAIVVFEATTVVDVGTLTAFASAPAPIAVAAADGLLHRGAPEELPAMVERMAHRTDTLPGRAAERTFGVWTPPSDGLLVDASTQAGRARAASMLFRRLGRWGDGWFTRHVDRRLSAAITRRLLPTGIAPNAITIVSVSIGLTGAALFATGDEMAAIAGALLFLASTIIDGCDGEVARLTFRESRFGARLDLIGDNVVHLGLFAGIAIGLYRQDPATRIAVLGVLLVVGVVVSMATVWWSLVARLPTQAQQRLFEAFASREFAYGLVVLTMLGLLEWFLWAAAIGNYVFSGMLLVLGRRARPS